MKRKMVGGDEYDVFTQARHQHFWQSGEIKRLKRKANKRERAQAKRRIKVGAE